MNNQEEIIDFMNAYITMKTLSNEKINYHMYDSNNSKRIYIEFNNRDIPVKNIVVYARNKFSKNKHLCYINIRGNFVFDGRRMRSKLLKSNIREYTKSTGVNGSHHYRILFENVSDLEAILKCFNRYLPN